MAKMWRSAFVVLSLVGCKGSNMGTPINPVTKDSGHAEELDSRCDPVRAPGTYTKDTRYTGTFFMPSSDAELANFCRASVADCIASATTIPGRAICEDANQKPGICAADLGPNPVFCYPAIREPN